MVKGIGGLFQTQRDQREPGFVQEAVIIAQGWHMTDMQQVSAGRRATAGPAAEDSLSSLHLSSSTVFAFSLSPSFPVFAFCSYFSLQLAKTFFCGIHPEKQ